MTNAFMQFVNTGKFGFKSLVTSILKDIERIAAEKAVAGLFNMILSAWGGQSYGAEGTSTYNSMGGVTHIGGRANGGPVGAGSIHRVVENGPELLNSGSDTYLMMGGKGGYVTPISGSSGASSTSGDGGDVYFEQNITIDNGGETNTNEHT